jgi:hypothetical protein
VDALAFELGSPWAQLVVFATETGLRPEEWIAVERVRERMNARSRAVERSGATAKREEDQC